MGQLNRIAQRPEIMGGKACIRGFRVTAGMIVGRVGAGRSSDELLAEYPYLEREDVLRPLRYAAAHDFVVLTHDLDFGAVLAATQGTRPSVVKIRSDDLSSAAIGEPLIAA